MRVVLDKPPNYAAIAMAFPVEGRPVLFCYSDAIFNPCGATITPELLAHEYVHSVRQGGEPDLWWGLYLKSAAFRLQEEIPAHQAEWQAYASTHNRHERRAYLRQLVKRLASPLYGRLVSKGEARHLILGGQ